MRVEVQGRRDRGMAKPFLDHLRMHVLSQHQRCVRMAEIGKSHAGDSDTPCDPTKCLGNCSRKQRGSHGVAENQAIIQHPPSQRLLFNFFALPEKLKTTRMFGCSSSITSAIAGNASISDEAAYTMSSVRAGHCMGVGRVLESACVQDGSDFA